MTPEEKAVIEAAVRFNRRGGSDRELALRIAVQRMELSRRPEHKVEPVPCGSVSRGGAMRCELRRGHNPDVGRQLWHQGRAADGSRRVWREMLR